MAGQSRIRFGLYFMLGAVGFAGASDWPQFRGPNADGCSPEKIVSRNWQIKPPKALWQVTLGDNGYTGPAIARGRVYVIDHSGSDDVVRSIDIRTGKDVWTYRYFEDKPDVWGAARSTPTIFAGKVYTVSRTGTVCCLNEADGKLVWTKNLVKDFSGMPPQWSYASSPFVDGERLILVTGAKGYPVCAVNRNTGKLLWRAAVQDDAAYATPLAATIEGVRQYVVFLGRSVVGLKPESGEALWQFRWVSGNICQPMVLGNRVCLFTEYGRGSVGFDIVKGQPVEVWRNKDLQPQFSAPVLHKGYIYGTTTPGDFFCADPKDGRILWRQKGFEKGGLMAADGLALVHNGANGDLIMVAMDPKGYKELGRIKPFAGRSWTAPVLANGKLVVRNTKMMACYDLK